MWRTPFLLTAASLLLVSCGGGSLMPTPPGTTPPRTVPPRDAPVTALPPDGPQPPVSTFPADANPLTRGPVYVDEVSLLQMESYPVQVALRVTGSLPTPCHALDWEILGPDSGGRIEITLFSEADSSLVCIQVLEPFEASIPLGPYTAGSFTVWLNGELVGDFSL